MTAACGWIESPKLETPTPPTDPRRARSSGEPEAEIVDLTGRDVIFSSLLNHLAG